MAMIAFASNSLLCRAALKQMSIDAASFTFIRIFSGAVTLWLILMTRRKLIVRGTDLPFVESSSDPSLVTRHSSLKSGDWISALSAGTGALLLFGAVQATMILWGFRKGERLDAIQIPGLAIAIAGLIVLVFPGLTSPPLIGSILMLGAGLAWGVYSLRGKTAGDAVAATTGNFLRAVPFAALVSVLMLPRMHLDPLGVTYAVISGAITSGLGYVIWYAALPGLKAASAATVQLSVPVLAATGGILLLGEPITLRYVIASIAVLGGIFLVVIEERQASTL